MATTAAGIPRDRVLVGRESELAALRAGLDAAASGAGHIVLLTGTAGIGKTRLLEEVLERARRDGAVVLHATTEELEVARPFGSLAGALGGCDAVSTDVARLVAAAASGRGDPAGAPQFEVIDAVLDHLEDLSASSTVVLAVDDLQWADPATLTMLRGLCRRLATLPMALVVTSRPLPCTRQLDRVIEALLAHPAARHLQLAPLDDGEVAALLASVVDAEPGDSLRAQVQRAAGNPFYIHELLRAFDEDRAIELREGRAEVIHGHFPATLGSTIVRYLRFLDAEALELLELAAVLGTSFSSSDLAAVSGRGVDELVGPLRQGIEAGVLHDRADGFAFRHDLVREALYRRQPQGLRSQLHLSAGKALAAAGAPRARAATHVAIGAQQGDADTIFLLRHAALETAMTAPEIAEGFARRAIELTAPSDPMRGQLQADLVALLVASGRATAAHDLAREVLDAAPDRSLDGRVRFALGQCCYLLGDTAGAIEHMHLAARHPSLTPAEQALALAEAGMVQLLGSGDLGGAEKDANEALVAARQAGDALAESMAMCVLAAIHQFRGSIGAAITSVQQATKLSAGPLQVQPGTLTSALRDPHMFHGMALLDADDLDAAMEAFRAGTRVSADRGVAGRGHFYHYWFGYRHYLAGDWDDARAELETGLALAEEIENRRGTLAAHALLALMALHRGALDEATDHVTRSEERFQRDGPDFGVPWMLLGRALLAEAEGDAPAGCAVLAGTWQALAGIGSRFHYRALGPDLVRLAVATGEAALALEVTAAMEQHAADEPVATIRGAALHCRGMMDEDRRALLAAVEALRSGPRPLPLALALEDAASTVAREDTRRDDARQLFVEARSLYQELSAERDIARLVSRMRAAGLRTGASGPRKRPDHGWESLTPTELRVVELVAEGQSNPQIGERLFVSRRTVQTHVSNVLRKLTLSSRTELAAEMARRGHEVS